MVQASADSAQREDWRSDAGWAAARRFRRCAQPDLEQFLVALEEVTRTSEERWRHPHSAGPSRKVVKVRRIEAVLLDALNGLDYPQRTAIAAVEAFAVRLLPAG